MNEQIRKFAEQAQQYAEHTTPQGLEWLPAFQEKFAKLIVEKCIASLQVPKADLKYLNEYNQGWVRGRLLAIENIKKDFEIL
jgi:endonuclease/exonuclease/phosphatase (EEP) superfamily protein YafD